MSSLNLLGMKDPICSSTIERVDILYFFSIALTNVFPESFLEYDNNRTVQMGIDLNTTNYEHNIPTDFLSLPNHFKNSRLREIYLLTAFV